MDKVNFELPRNPGRKEYTLFPSENSKKRRGGSQGHGQGGGSGHGHGNGQRSRRCPEKLPVNFVTQSRGHENTNYKLLKRGTPRGQSDNVKQIDRRQWPDIDGSSRYSTSVSEVRKPRSFAEMVKTPSTVKDKKEKAVVVNQISAFTYNKIGRSDDESKYVSSKQQQIELELDSGENKNWKTIPSAVRSDVEVEFIDSDAEVEEDDFEVEFSTAATVRSDKKHTVNKISAMTFQNIGKTEQDNEPYVMHSSKTWSSVVGKRVEKSQETRVKLSTVDKDEGTYHEPTLYDKIRAKMKDGIELTTEEREILRQKRRERRKKEQEKKKKEKENKKLHEMLKPQTTKLNIISGDLLEKVKKGNNVMPSNSSSVKKPSKEIKFKDEEYPDLGVKVKAKFVNDVISTEIVDSDGRIMHSDRESNSEWETEDEVNDAVEGIDQLDINDSEKTENIEVITDSTPMSYSSILKTAKKQANIPGIIKIPPKEKAPPPEEVVEKKKNVKKNDPIMFDINTALTIKPKKKAKAAQVVTGKLKKDPVKQVTIGRNTLDSTAPKKKRGKERETVKKKKKSVMKKIIIAEREMKRLEAEKRRNERIKKGIIMKPLPVKDDEAEDNQKPEINEEADHILEVPKEKIEEAVKEVVAETESDIVQKSLEESVESKARKNLHSRKFRTYCNHILSNEVNSTISLLMADLIRFQDKQYHKDPEKAKSKRRYVVGLREVAKFLKVKKIHGIIFAPDIEKVETEGGLDDAVGKLIADAELMGVPVIFGLNRYKLGRTCLKKVPISCIGILNYQGSDENFKSLLSQTEILREQYKTKLQEEIERILNPPSLHRPPSNSSTTLSCDAAEFVPSFSSTFWPSEASFHGQLAENYYNQYNFYENPYNYATVEDNFDLGEETLIGEKEVWGNMLDILKG